MRHIRREFKRRHAFLGRVARDSNIITEFDTESIRIIYGRGRVPSHIHIDLSGSNIIDSNPFWMEVYNTALAGVPIRIKYNHIGVEESAEIRLYQGEGMKGPTLMDIGLESYSLSDELVRIQSRESDLNKGETLVEFISDDETQNILMMGYDAYKAIWGGRK